MRDPRLAPLRAFDGMGFIEGTRAVMRALRIEPDAAFADQPPITRALYGYFGYGVSGLFEPKLAKVLPTSSAEACLALPGTVVLFDPLYNRLCQLSLTDLPVLLQTIKSGGTLGQNVPKSDPTDKEDSE